jgi:hypothetical protein
MSETITIKTGQSGTGHECEIEWRGTAEVCLPCRQETDRYPHMFDGLRRVPAALARYRDGRRFAAVLLPAPDPDGRERWTTLQAESARISAPASCREWETADGDLVGDVDQATAALIEEALQSTAGDRGRRSPGGAR